MTDKQKERQIMSIVTLVFSVVVIGICIAATVGLAILTHASGVPLPLELFIYGLIISYIIGVALSCPIEDFIIISRWARGKFIEEDEYNTRIGF